MSILNSATLDGAFESLKGVFDATLQNAQAASLDLNGYMDSMTGTGKTVTVSWFGDVPALRRWVGDRHLRTLKGSGYTISNVPWEDTVSVPVIDFNTDQFGLIGPQIKRMARESVAFKLRRFAAALAANGLCADGQNLIDTDHPKDSGTTWSNKGTSALSFSTLETAVYTGAEITDSNGDPAGINYDVLMGPARLRSTMEQLCLSVGLPGSANNDINPLRGLTPVVNPYLTDTNNWYLLDTNATVKPFIYTEAAGSSFGAIEEDRTQVFAKGEILYGISGWAEVSPYFPYAIYGGIVSGG